MEFLCKVVTRLEAEKLQREAVIASRKSSFSDVPDGGASGGKNAAMILPGDNLGLLPHGPASTSEPIAKEIHQKLEGLRSRNVRDQLFEGEGRYGSDLSESGEGYSQQRIYI